MDAQNAVDTGQTKPSGASAQQPGLPPEVKSPMPSNDLSAAQAAEELRQPKSGIQGDNLDEQDSDAETIVIGDKDNHSPSKVRKVRQEDLVEGDGGDQQPRNRLARPEDDKSTRSADALLDGLKKKRPLGLPDKDLGADRDRPSARKKDPSSGLSSAPASPEQRQRQLNSRHRPDQPNSSASSDESDGSKARSSTKKAREKHRTEDRSALPKRKTTRPDSDGDDEASKTSRPRNASVATDGSRQPNRDQRNPKSQHDSRQRSPSPQPRMHRRSTSTQLPTHASNGFGHKKKRLPPPLQPTDYHSDSSSAASGSPRARSSKVRSLTTPATGDSTMSPAKMGPHKKHLDAHGQTLLARACARGEYETAKQRLSDRPEDLNVADYAGNTPLQIAAINGCEDIVRLLIDAGCALDCVNYDKETPLLDAVDNGHVSVIKLLLDAGVNPRKANVSGEEPIDRVTEETENGEQIKELLIEARKRHGERRRTSEDRYSHHDNPESRDSHAPDSPRQSPANPALATARRGGTVRATKTRNELLYMPLDEKTLRQAAGRGDEETVARILQVKEGFDDPESMVAAARGGHDLVIQLLLGLGGANPDPDPVPSLQAEFATPILAAIGQENIKVLELLLDQGSFNPTRRFKGETYYEIASRRQGPNWKDEETLLKSSYDAYKRTHRDRSKGTKSPGRREREREKEREERREERRGRKVEGRDPVNTLKRNHTSPARDGEPRKKPTTSSFPSPKDKKVPAASTEEPSQKRSVARPKKDSDREPSPALSAKPPKVRLTESDTAAMSSEGESVKPRRKLVSKGELRGERERHRRTSLTSNASSFKEPSSPQEPRQDDSDRPRPTEKYRDRAKALRKDEGRDVPVSAGDGAIKRHRASLTPDRAASGEREPGEIPAKRRRLDPESKERSQGRSSSTDGRLMAPASRDNSVKPLNRLDVKREKQDGALVREPRQREPGRSSPIQDSIHVKTEYADTEMPDVEDTRDAEAKRAHLIKKREEREKRREADEAEEAKKREAQRKLQEEANQKKQEEELQKQKQKEKEKEKEEEEKRRAEAERLAEAQRKEEEELKERQRLEAEEKARVAAEERKRREAEEQKRKLEEEEQRKREEEERLRKEQLEREAAEDARRQREEEERAEKARRERAHREEQERKRAAREAEQKRLQEERERARLDRLPALLRWFSTRPNPRSVDVARALPSMEGFRYDTIRQEARHTPEGRELWVLGCHVAMLIGETDLDLSRYTAWEREPMSLLAKKYIWKSTWTSWSLAKQRYYEMGHQIPGYYESLDPLVVKHGLHDRLNAANWERFEAMDLYFVKLSDFLSIVPNFPHLQHMDIEVVYREIPDSEDDLSAGKMPRRYLQNPDAATHLPFRPPPAIFRNGAKVGISRLAPAELSKTPFPEARVPRRGLVRVLPEDPDYERLCREQGLQHLLPEAPQPPIMINGVHDNTKPVKVNGVSSNHDVSGTPNGDNHDAAKAQ